MDHLVYLDHAATTAARPEVVEAMLPYFTEKYGNPSSIYSLGSETKAAITHAREIMAKSTVIAFLWRYRQEYHFADKIHLHQWLSITSFQSR